jgi:hypothetical protein
VLFSKTRSHDLGDSVARILERKHLVCGKTATSKNTNMKKMSHATESGATSAQRKSPALPGFLTTVVFDQLTSRAWLSDARAARPYGSHCSCE